MTTTSTLSQRLRAARAAITPSITQRDVAKRLGLSPSAVNLWEAGKTEPSASVLAELATWYGVSSDWLLGVESKVTGQHRVNTGAPSMIGVPVVHPADLARWHWPEPTEAVQTAMSYPAQTAAAITVTSEAMASACPVGSIAIISKGHPIESGSLVLVTIGKSTEPVLRKYIQEGADGLLIADDVRYPSYRLADGAKLIGRVTEVIIRRALI